MDDQRGVGSTLATGTPVEGWMLGEDVVREVLARLARGEHVKTIARELGVDKKTIKRWRRRGAWQPRVPRGVREGDRRLSRVSDATRSRGRLEWDRAAPRAPGAGLHGRLSAGAASAPAAADDAPLGGARDGALRDRPWGAGAGRFRPAAASGSLTSRRRSISLSSRSASRAGPWPTRTGMSGSIHCSTAMSGRSGISAACR